MQSCLVDGGLLCVGYDTAVTQKVFEIRYIEYKNKEGGKIPPINHILKVKSKEI